MNSASLPDDIDLTARIAGRLSAALSYAILLAGLLTAVAAVYMVVASYSALPSTDGWEQIDVAMQGANPLSPAWLWQQHNEHRMVIPKLFLAADLLWFRATQKFLLAEILKTQFLLLLLLSWSMRTLGVWRGTVWRTGVGIAAFCLFWPTQWENLIIGFSIDFILLIFFATLSFVELVLYWKHSQQPDNRRAWIYLLLSVVAALAATYSLANGNLVWSLLVASALLLHLRRAAVLAFVVTGALSTALYLFNYRRPPGHGNPASALRTPLAVVQYIATYLGSPFVRHSVALATCIGMAGLAAAFFVLLRFRTYARTARPLPVLLALILAFCLGTAFLTSLGRLNFGVRQAFASRYHTFALLLWCCLGLLLLMAESVANKRESFLLVQVGVLAIIVWSSLITRNDIRGARIRGFQINVAATALFAGARDDAQFAEAAITDPSAVSAEAEFMKKNGLSVYSDNSYTQLGKPLLSVYRPASSAECRGMVESIAAVKANGPSPVVRFAGWTWDREHQRPPSAIVFAQNGIITGLGAVGDWRAMTIVDNRRIENAYSGYAGYSRIIRPDAPLRIYAILRGQPQSACYLASTVTSPRW